MILVTGGLGFIGRHLVEKLLAGGASVRILDLANHHWLSPHPRCEIVTGDINDDAVLHRALEGCQQVYHLAANPNLWARDPSTFDRVNYRGTVHVIEKSLKCGVQSIVYVSTESILTAVPPTADIRFCELDFRRIIGTYCLSKARAEQFAMRLGRLGQRIIVVNPTLPIGPGDYLMTPPTRMAVQFLRGKLPGYLDVAFNLIDARDIAEQMINAAATGQPGQRYILGRHNTSLGEWLDALGQVVGRSRPALQIPFAVALAYSYISEGKSWFTGTMPDAPRTGVLLARHKMHFPTTLGGVLESSGRSLADSARDAVAFYREQGWID